MAIDISLPQTATEITSCWPAGLIVRPASSSTRRRAGHHCRVQTSRRTSMTTTGLHARIPDEHQSRICNRDGRWDEALSPSIDLPAPRRARSAYGLWRGAAVEFDDRSIDRSPAGTTRRCCCCACSGNPSTGLVYSSIPYVLQPSPVTHGGVAACIPAMHALGSSRGKKAPG